MEFMMVRLAAFASDPSDLALVLINGAAGAVIVWRALGRLSAMCCCSPHGIRIGAVLMAGGAFATLLGAVVGCVPLTWEQTCVIAGVAIHVLCDRRAPVRRQEPMRKLA